MIWQYVIVGLVVAVAAAAVVWQLIRALRGKGACGCGNCPVADTCKSRLEKGGPSARR